MQIVGTTYFSCYICKNGFPLSARYNIFPSLHSAQRNRCFCRRRKVNGNHISLLFLSGILREAQDELPCSHSADVTFLKEEKSLCHLYGSFLDGGTICVLNFGRKSFKYPSRNIRISLIIQYTIIS